MNNQINIRLNLDKPSHRQAQEILLSLPKGQKSDYVMTAVLLLYNSENMLKMVQETIESSILNSPMQMLSQSFTNTKEQQATKTNSNKKEQASSFLNKISSQT